MQKRSFEKSKWFMLAMTVALGIFLFAAAFRVMAAPPARPMLVPPERPAAALLAVSWRTTLITQTTNATASTTQNYAYHDLSCWFDFYNNQIVTVTVQASNDNSDWFNVVTFPQIVTDTIASTGIFTRLVSYGRYERLRMETWGSGYNVTPTCKSVFFNNWSPPAYAGEMNR